MEKTIDDICRIVVDPKIQTNRFKLIVRPYLLEVSRLNEKHVRAVGRRLKKEVSLSEHVLIRGAMSQRRRTRFTWCREDGPSLLYRTLKNMYKRTNTVEPVRLFLQQILSDKTINVNQEDIVEELTQCRTHRALLMVLTQYENNLLEKCNAVIRFTEPLHESRRYKNG